MRYIESSRERERERERSNKKDFFLKAGMLASLGKYGGIMELRVKKGKLRVEEEAEIMLDCGEGI